MSATNTAVDLMGGATAPVFVDQYRRVGMKITDEAVEAFTQYRRSQVAELRPWQPGDDVSGVSVSAEDAKAGSPKSGDMIARNPKNHADQWLVAAAYFADNFEPLAALPHLSQGAVRVKPLEWEAIGSRDLVSDTELGQYAINRDPYSAGGYFNLWMAGADDDRSSEYPSLPDAKAAAQADYERRIMSALASHEPAPETKRGIEDAKKRIAETPSGTMIDNLPDEVLFGDHSDENPAVRQPDPEPAKGGPEVVAFLVDCPVQPTLEFANVHVPDSAEPLVRQSALTACQQEVERLRAEVDGLKAEPFDTREGLSKWRGWDDSNYPWSQTHHKDSVLEAMFRDSWSVEDAAALLGFIDRTWGEQSNEA